MAVPPTIEGDYQLWWYYPSVPGNVVVAAIFLILTLTHLFFLVSKRKRFCIPLVVGGIFEIVGYGARVAAHYNPTTTITYAIQSVLILLAPILFAASVYMYLARIVIAVKGERQCLIPVRFLTKIFVIGDVICFFVQGAGGGLLASAESSSSVNVGENIILAGLVIQIGIFAFFVVVAGMFHLRMRSRAPNPWSSELPWQRLLLGLYLVSILIVIRNVARAVEYGMGSGGYLLRHEWITFVFDGAAMILVLVLCLTWYHSGVGSKRITPEDQATSVTSRDGLKMDTRNIV